MGYPWGSYNRSYRKGTRDFAYTAPDVSAHHKFGMRMQYTAGSVEFKDRSNSIREYVLGDMSSTVYPVGGGMEDWAYGAGWDNRDSDAARHECKP